MIARLKEYYRKEVVPKLMKEFQYKNINQAPKLEKIVVNMGIGEAKEDPKFLASAIEEMALITGQKPIVTRVKSSIAAFKIKKGMQIGCKVTLRGARMYEFFDRLVNVALARIRDFKGVSPKSFDKNGNFSLGIKEQIAFPEIDYDKVAKIHGLDVTIVINSNSIEESKELLRLMGMPFRK